MCGVKKCESKGIITFHHDGLQKKGIGSKMITPVSASAANTSLPKGKHLPHRHVYYCT